jgi:hypothetical protein
MATVLRTVVAFVVGGLLAVPSSAFAQDDNAVRVAAGFTLHWGGR